MLENERIHTVVYFNSIEKDFEEIQITDLETLTETVKRIILSINDNLYCQSPDVYLSDHGDLSLSSFTFISSSKEPDVLEYIDENVDADIRNAVIVVNTPDEAAEISTIYSSIHVTPVVIGRITASIKEIEL